MRGKHVSANFFNQIPGSFGRHRPDHLHIVLAASIANFLLLPPRSCVSDLLLDALHLRGVNDDAQHRVGYVGRVGRYQVPKDREDRQHHRDLRKASGHYKDNRSEAVISSGDRVELSHSSNEGNDQGRNLVAPYRLINERVISARHLHRME